jgi:general stress protein 26
MADQTPDANARKLSELIKDIDFCMLTTVSPDGSLRSRPLSTQDAEFDGTLWFFIKDDSGKVDEIQKDSRVNCSYAHPGKQHYVSVSGRASLVKDKRKMKEYWKPVLKAWFPDGLDDPHLALLKVDADKAEYWDSPSSTVMHLVGFVKALATGKEYEPGDNVKVKL